MNHQPNIDHHSFWTCIFQDYEKIGYFENVTHSNFSLFFCSWHKKCHLLKSNISSLLVLPSTPKSNMRAIDQQRRDVTYVGPRKYFSLRTYYLISKHIFVLKRFLERWKNIVPQKQSKLLWVYSSTFYSQLIFLSDLWILRIIFNTALLSSHYFLWYGESFTKHWKVIVSASIKLTSGNIYNIEHFQPRISFCCLTEVFNVTSIRPVCLFPDKRLLTDILIVGFYSSAL